MILVKRLNVVKKIEEKDLEAHERLGFKLINGAVNKPAEVAAEEALTEETVAVAEATEPEASTEEAPAEETTKKTSKKK